MSNDQQMDEQAEACWRALERIAVGDSCSPQADAELALIDSGRWQARAALASKPAQGGAYPSKCPITGRQFFMAIEHPKLGTVPTYGGPYDSYTIPHAEGEPHTPWHERELACYRYDHDLGGWVDGTEDVPLRIIHEDVLFGLEERPPVPAQPVREPMSWQPIETAPKDFVTEFDGWNGERVPNVSWAHPGCAAKGEYDWCVSEYISGHGYENARVRGLTHWMPLPAAPGITKE